MYARCHPHEVNKIVTLCYVMLETFSSTYSTFLCLQFFYLMCHASGHFDLQCLPNVFKIYCRGNNVICEVVLQLYLHCCKLLYYLVNLQCHSAVLYLFVNTQLIQLLCFMRNLSGVFRDVLIFL